MQNITNAVRVANSSEATIILLSDSTVWSCGDNSKGKTGLGTNGQNLTPIQIQGLPKIIDIKSNFIGSVALSDSGYVYSWGKDSLLSSTYNYSPIRLSNLDSIVAISACDDGNHYLALDENKNCYAWGGNNFGKCGIIFTNSWIGTPQIVATDVIDIMAGEHFSYIEKSEKSLWAAGANLTSGSIWLNLTNIMRWNFTQIDPSQVPDICEIILNTDVTHPLTSDSDSIGMIFPNVFSPNGDGVNDEFYFLNVGVTDIYWRVYNRWGTLVFETKQIKQSWDGRTKAGKECSEGTYFYIVDYKMANIDWERITGYVTLFR